MTAMKFSLTGIAYIFFNSENQGLLPPVKLLMSHILFLNVLTVVRDL